MANNVYPKYKEALLGAAANVSLNQNTATDGPFCLLVDTGTYTFNPTHQFRNDIMGGSVIGTEQRIATPTIVGGLFDGDNVTFTAVTGVSVEALVIYRKNTGAASTQFLFSYLDSSVTGLPVVPNGGDISVTWNASGIVQL